MHPQEDNTPYLLISCIFYVFGLKWCYDYAKYPICIRQQTREDDAPRKKFSSFCRKLMSNHTVEGSLKLIATAVGLAGTLVGGLRDETMVSPQVVYTTIYLFFAFPSLVDVLHFYFNLKVSEGFAKMALAQSFFVEGFLFVWASSSSEMVDNILTGVVWLTAISTALELVWPDTKLFTGTLTLLHGSWISHLVRLHQSTDFPKEKMAITCNTGALFWHTCCLSMI